MSSKDKKSAAEIERDRAEEEGMKKKEEKRKEREEQREEKLKEAMELEKRKSQNKEAAEEVQRKLMKKKNNPYFYYYVTFAILGLITLYVIIMTFVNQATPLHKVMTIEENKIEEHNQSFPWKQGASSFFEGTTLADAKKMISSNFASHSNLARCGVDDSVNIPESFDSRTQWPACVLPTRNQHISCGSGYAFAIAQSASERMCIASKTQKLVNLSAMELLSCDTNNSGCKSGFLNNSADYLKTKGLVEESCFPYKVENGEVPTCDKICADQNRRKIDGYCVLFGEEDIKREIFKNGPVFSVISVHIDFLTYKSGIYSKGEEVPKFGGHHGIKIIGWGVENGTELEPNQGNKYWIVQNSWGEDWGEQGYARISMGQELMFDQYAYALKVPSERVEQPKKVEQPKPSASTTSTSTSETPAEESLDLGDIPEDDGKKTEI